jgi:hypothetical protein
MDVMTLADAAERLGVSPRQAQRLAAAGDLTRAVGNVVTTESVARALAQRNANAHLTRAWSKQTAWAALALLSGRDDLARGIGQAQLSRLRARLRAATPESLAASLRMRASVHQYEAHPSALARLAPKVTVPGTGDGAGTLAPRDATGVDGYVNTADLARLVGDFALIPALGAPHVVLRATDYTHVKVIAESGAALLGADLATSVDARERSEGLRLLADAIERHAR